MAVLTPQSFFISDSSELSETKFEIVGNLILQKRYSLSSPFILSGVSFFATHLIKVVKAKSQSNRLTLLTKEVNGGEDLVREIVQD